MICLQIVKQVLPAEFFLQIVKQVLPAEGVARLRDVTSKDFGNFVDDDDR